jgi:hypothetical protein
MVSEESAVDTMHRLHVRMCLNLTLGGTDKVWLSIQTR